MKTKLSIFLTAVLVLALFAFTGCGEDEEKPQNFDSIEEAQLNYNLLSIGGEGAVLLALDEARAAAELADDFDGTDIFTVFKAPKNHETKLTKKTAANTFGYDPSTGFWTLDTSFVDTTDGQTISVDILGKLRFTPREANGLPNDQTDKMEYVVDASSDANLGDEITSIILALTYHSNFDVMGIAGYRDSTGNATISGDNNTTLDFDATTQGQSYSGTFKISYSITNLVFRPRGQVNDEYPVSGIIDFTLKATSTAAQSAGDFYVAGKITFDGDNTASMTFGGYNFIIDLDTGDITPVS